MIFIPIRVPLHYCAIQIFVNVLADISANNRIAVSRGPVKSPLKKIGRIFFLRKSVLRGLNFIPKENGSSYDHLAAVFYQKK